MSHSSDRNSDGKPPQGEYRKESIDDGTVQSPVRRRPVGLLALVVVMGALTWLLTRPGPLLPQRLDIVVGSDTPDLETSVGTHKVLLRFVKDPPARDKGKVTIEVVVDGRLQEKIPAFYNYDLWQNDPAGTLTRVGEDLRVEPNDHGPQPAYRIRAKDGRVIRRTRPTIFRPDSCQSVPFGRGRP